jgi:hypothetical protein
LVDGFGNVGLELFVELAIEAICSECVDDARD